MQEVLPAAPGVGSSALRPREAMTCPTCAHTVPGSTRVCPNCFSLLDSVCEGCGGQLDVRRLRVRIASGLRLALEIVGVLVIIATFASIVGPFLGLLLILLAERFGYRTEAHHFCAACRKQHQPRPAARLT